VINDETFSLGPVLVYRIREPKSRRGIQLIAGLCLFGIALGLSVEAALGVNPWTVFHGGLSERLPISIGVATMAVGVVLVCLFLVLREPFGLGTFLNALMIGPIIDATLYVVPDLTTMPARLAALAAAPALIGLASGLYIGAGLGPGPRDGLMTALERRGMPIWAARLTIEASALLAGWILGGDVGWGTVWMAGSVGFFVQFFLIRLRIDA